MITRTDYVCSDSEDEMTMGADYACSGSEDEVTMRCLAKGYFQDWARVVEIDLRGRPKIAVTKVIPQRVTLGMGQGMRLQLELRYI